MNESTKDEKEKKKEKEKDKVKGIAMIDGIYYKAPSPDMILLPFLSITNDSMTFLPDKMLPISSKNCFQG